MNGSGNEPGVGPTGAAAAAMSRRAVLAMLMLTQPIGAARSQPAPLVSEWAFTVSLDGTRIGSHRFEVQQDGASSTVHGVAEFAVRVFGLTIYRYRHEVVSRWKGNCLVSLAAHTNDDGEATAVTATAAAGALRVVRRTDGAGQSESSVAGCLMDFAYWSPDLLSQTRLLNPQTGEIEDVKIVPGDTGEIQVRGATVPARSWRILGSHQPVEVWYSTQRAWIGLDATVRGGRTLSYRLP